MISKSNQIKKEREKKIHVDKIEGKGDKNAYPFIIPSQLPTTYKYILKTA